MKKLISIISPCYNEHENVETCWHSVEKLFKDKLSTYDYEHIFCDNASTDNTIEILKGIARRDKRVRIIINTRNYGPFRSTFNALMSAKGDAVLVLLPVDGQDPPELIADFVKKWEEGYQVVYGIRNKRREGVIISSIRKLYYRLVNRLADVYLPPDVGEFQLIDRIVVEALKKYDDYYPYIRGMIANCGFKSMGIKYVWKARERGFSKNRLYHLIDQGLNGLISFTNVPLRLCMLFGFILAGSSIAYAFMTFVINLVYYRRFSQPGIATLIVALFFFAGVQLFFLGLLGEYIGAINSQVRKKPMVIERERINFDD